MARYDPRILVEVGANNNAQLLISLNLGKIERRDRERTVVRNRARVIRALAMCWGVSLSRYWFSRSFLLHLFFSFQDIF